MKINTFACDFCGDDVNDADELMGVVNNGLRQLRRVDLNDAKFHLCYNCIRKMGEFYEAGLPTE